MTIDTTSNDQRNNSVTQTRLQLREAGYSPIPVRGKDPKLPGWNTKHEVDPAEIERWEKNYPDHQNTGLLTRSMPTFDIDILDERAAARVQAVAYARFGNAGDFLVRTGMPPKRAIPFRTDAPFRKISISLYGPNDDRSDKPKQRLEFLCDGQQVVCHGIHPDTGQPYTWKNGHPPDVKWDELPHISEAKAEELIEFAAELLVAEHGYTRAKEQPPEQPPGADKGSKPYSEAEDKKLRSVLAFIPVDEKILTEKFGDSHLVWINIGRALHRLGWGEKGKAIWRDWSRGCKEKFKEKGIDDNWRSFGDTLGNEPNPITIATVFYYAKKFGWEAAPGTKSALVTTAAADVEMHAVDWLWPDRFALGAINLIAGLPDMGKGQIAAFIAAAVTNGIALPCGEGQCVQGNVIWLNAEDNASTTVIPRLVAAGADLNRIHFATATRVDGKDKTFSLVTDLPLLRQAIERIGDVVLVIIDPISAYLGVGKVDSRQATDVRGVLTPLKELVEEFHFALLGIAHFNKKEDTKSAMLRVSDSIAYVAAARSVYVVFDDPNPEVPGQKLFIKAKNNIARDVQGLRYDFRIKEKVGYDNALDKAIDGPYINWGLEHVDMTANDAMAAADGRKNSARREAQDFLRERLSSGPVKADDIEDEAFHEGISKRTLKRAKSELKIRSKRQGGSHGEWYWHMPATPRE
jgi:putative DNA primase/helicase